MVMMLPALVLLAVSAAGPKSDPVARWFEAGRCPASGADYRNPLPFTKHDGESIVVAGDVFALPLYAYDPRSGIAEYHNPSASDGALTVRTSSPPPVKVEHADLRGVRTTSGITLGSAAATVVRVLGKPFVIHACGAERFAYLRNRDGEQTLMELTIRAGRVVEIYEDFGG